MTTSQQQNGLSLAQWQRAGRYFTYNNVEIFYHDSRNSDLIKNPIEGEDSRPTLLLIHGFPTASWDWYKVWPSLSYHFRVISLDMVGFGFSGKPALYEYSIFNQANVCEACLKHLNIERCHIVAHDYGDSVAQELLYRHANTKRTGSSIEIQSATLLNGGLFPETHRPKLIQTLLNSPIGGLIANLVTKKSVDKSMRSIFGQSSQPSEQELADMWHLISFNQGQRVFHKLISYMSQRKQHRQRWLEALTDAMCPLQIINGSEDPISGEHMVVRYETLVSTCHIKRLTNIGHYPQMEAPDAVSDATISFINNQ